MDRYGPEYAFRIFAKNANDSFSINKVRILQNLTPSERDKLKFEQNQRIGQFLNAPFEMYGKPLSEWITDNNDESDFSILSVKSEEDAEQGQIVKVAFRMKVSASPEPVEGTWTLLPESCWVLQKYQLRIPYVKDSEVVTVLEGMSMEYNSPNSKERCFPDLIEFYQRDLESGKEKLQAVQVASVEFGTVTPDEMKLARLAFQTWLIGNQRSTGCWFFCGERWNGSPNTPMDSRP